MARKTKPSSDIVNFDVHQEPLFTEDGHNVGALGMMRRDTPNNPILLGTCTEQYGVVKNADLIDMVETNLGNHPLLKKYESKKFVVKDGARFYGRYDFPDFKTHLKPVGQRAKGDILGLRLTVNNSYDRSCRVSLSLGFMRLVCENGMVSLSKEFSMNKRHTLAINLDFVADALTRAVKNTDLSAHIFNRLAEKAFSDEQGISLLSKLEGKKLISRKVRRGIEAVWLNPEFEDDKPRNLYNLYNATTQYLTRYVSNERYEYSQGINEKVLKILSGKTRDQELLQLVA
jgi:hypothetical protein